jgi:hypothetical protein
MLEVHNLKSRFRDDGHRLNVYVRIRQQQPLLCDGLSKAEGPLQEFPPEYGLGN